ISARADFGVRPDIPPPWWISARAPIPRRRISVAPPLLGMRPISATSVRRRISARAEIGAPARADIPRRQRRIS
ncbi:unnamed protein product, partial [Effrenium voratum]